jgi:hypothetical protein
MLSDLELYQQMIACVNIHPSELSDAMEEIEMNVYLLGKLQKFISSFSTKQQRSSLSPEVLAKRWGIGLNAAKTTLENTTQTGIRNVFLPSKRKVQKKAPWRLNPSIKSDFYTDQLFSKIKDVHNHNGGLLFTNGLGYNRFYLWRSKGEHLNALKEFIDDASDNAPEEIYGESRKICQKYHIRQRVTVPHSPWKSLAEASI